MLVYATQYNFVYPRCEMDRLPTSGLAFTAAGGENLLEQEGLVLGLGYSHGVKRPGPWK